MAKYYSPTAAGNLMASYEAGVEARRLKRENKILEKGPLGYTGGIAGFMQDTASGIAAWNIKQRATDIFDDMTDTRTMEQRYLDEWEEKFPFIDNIRNVFKEEIGSLGVNYIEEYKNMYLGGTPLVSYSNDGTKINYTLGKKSGLGILDNTNIFSAPYINNLDLEE